MRMIRRRTTLAMIQASFRWTAEVARLVVEATVVAETVVVIEMRLANGNALVFRVWPNHAFNQTRRYGASTGERRWRRAG